MTTNQQMLDTFNKLPDKVKLALLYEHNQEFREALQEKVWSILNPECSNPNHGFFISNWVLFSCANRT